MSYDNSTSFEEAWESAKPWKVGACELSAANRHNVCALFYSCQLQDSFLDKIVTGDEK